MWKKKPKSVPVLILSGTKHHVEPGLGKEDIQK